MRYLGIYTLTAILCLGFLFGCGSGETTTSKKAGSDKTETPQDARRRQHRESCNKAIEYLDKVNGVYSAYSNQRDIDRRLGELQEQYATVLAALPAKASVAAGMYPSHWACCSKGVTQCCQWANDGRIAVQRCEEE